MRISAAITVLLSLTACTAMMVGGGQPADRAERSAAVALADSAISGKIRSQYAADSVVGAFEVGIRTWNGTVTLSGTVGSFAAREQAESIASNTGGVRAVHNYIRVEDRSVK